MKNVFVDQILMRAVTFFFSSLITMEIAVANYFRVEKRVHNYGKMIVTRKILGKHLSCCSHYSFRLHTICEYVLMII